MEELRRAATDLNRLSDLLCRVIELSDFVRSVHPDRKLQAAATQAYAMTFEYMNVLNTTTGLNDELKEERMVAVPCAILSRPCVQSALGCSKSAPHQVLSTPIRVSYIAAKAMISSNILTGLPKR